MPLTPEHLAKLSPLLPPDLDLDALGIESVPAGVTFPWRSAGGAETYQLLPDVPRTDSKGKVIKYEFPSGAQTVIHCLRDEGGDGPVLVVEGTKQRYWALAYAPPHYAVYAIAGCAMWKDDLSWAEGRTVAILMDGDWKTNPDVHRSLSEFREALDLMGAEQTQVVSIPAGKRDKDGLDDVLLQIAPEQRAKFLARWLDKASAKPLGRGPSAKSSNRFMGKDGLMARSLANDILATQPAALTAENHVSIYRNGVYQPNPMALMSEVELRLEEQHRSTHLSSAEQSVKAALYRSGKILPERMDRPLANFTNGMVDLRTGALLPHDPSYLSRAQHPVAWDPTAACPVYEAWLAEVIPDQASDLEEVAGTMLDPSRTPSKALFAYGPSHSGKSTFLRLLEAVAGAENTSAVTLHALAEDRFAAANVYGKILNTGADLAPKDVADLSVFKMMTGEDSVTGNRKYGGQFKFTNTALFAFSANELPAVGESSRAYSNRMKPFHFKHSFEGREDPSLEAKLREELPGIVRRWAEAYWRLLARGNYAVTDTATRSEFESGSDRVRQWVAEIMRVVPTGGRTVVPPDAGSGATALTAMFGVWANENGMAKLGRNRLMNRLTSIDGVEAVRIAPMKTRGYNLVARPEGEQGFDFESGVVAKVAELGGGATDAGFDNGGDTENGVRGIPEEVPLPTPPGFDQVQQFVTYTEGQ